MSPYIIEFRGAYSLDGSVFIALEAMDGSLVDLIALKKVYASLPLGLCVFVADADCSLGLPSHPLS